jgi:hypothetical protein
LINAASAPVKEQQKLLLGTQEKEVNDLVLHLQLGERSGFSLRFFQFLLKGFLLQRQQRVALDGGPAKADGNCLSMHRSGDAT